MNDFSSNIQGLPTWYEVRVSERGYLGRRGGVDLLVPMNPQTWAKDIAEVAQGGYVFYDSTRSIDPAQFRDDLHLIGMPLTAIANSTYSEPRQRQLFKNIIYVGALSWLLDIEAQVIEQLFSEQYKGKEKLLAGNVRALHLGRDYARDSLPTIGLKIRRADAVGDRIFVDGNSAAALGCVYGGASVCAWYPITPSSSVAEAFQTYCQKMRIDPATGQHRYAIVQAEDELASTGMPTRTQQADILAYAYASHGDTKHPLLLPKDPHECFEMSALALDLADRLQTPIFVMTDLDIGMNQRLSEPFTWDDTRIYDRGKVMTAQMLEQRDFGRYLDVDGDGIPFRTYPGTRPDKGAFFTRGTTRDPYARYSEEGPVYVDNVQRLLRKFATASALVPAAVRTDAACPTRVGVISYGSTSPAMDEALDLFAQAGMHLDSLRLRAFPFGPEVLAFIESHDQLFVVEQNRDAQMRALLVNEFEVAPGRLVPILHFDGTPITAGFIVSTVSQALEATGASIDA